jgi:hypothetical protein
MSLRTMSDFTHIMLHQTIAVLSSLKLLKKEPPRTIAPQHLQADHDVIVLNEKHQRSYEYKK